MCLSPCSTRQGAMCSEEELKVRHELAFVISRTCECSEGRHKCECEDDCECADECEDEYECEDECEDVCESSCC